MFGRPFAIPGFARGGSVVALAAMLLAAAIPAAGQLLTSRVDGRVLDQTGAVVPGVTVTLTNAATNVARETSTNSSGLYVFPNVSQGTYSVEAAADGFKTALIEDVQVALGAPANVDIVVEVGVVTQTVVVTAAETQSVMNEVNAEINTNLNREQVKDLPLNGRGVVQLALTQAGVTSPGGTRSAAINGGRGTFNNFTLDGINNQDTFIRTDALFGTIPVQESFIEEVSITTANADVDAGLGSSQTHFVTRSGGNAYHGEVFYYHRNDALNANDYFNNAAGIDKERVFIHQFGFNVGGPILKDKLFFFVQLRGRAQPRHGLGGPHRPDPIGPGRQFQLRQAGQRPDCHGEPLRTLRIQSRPGHRLAGGYDPAAQRQQRGRRKKHFRLSLQQHRQERRRLVCAAGRL